MKNQEIMEITPPPLCFDENAKIFFTVDEDTGEVLENYSFNEWLEKIKNISGINEDLIGKNESVTK